MRFIRAVPGRRIVSVAASTLFVALCFWLTFKLVWWVLEPIKWLVIVYIVVHGAVKIHAKAADAHAKIARARILRRDVVWYERVPRRRRGRG
jgi:hypothetical protein